MGAGGVGCGSGDIGCTGTGDTAVLVSTEDVTVEVSLTDGEGVGDALLSTVLVSEGAGIGVTVGAGEGSTVGATVGCGLGSTEGTGLGIGVGSTEGEGKGVGTGTGVVAIPL
jgi:hypothetical protein